MNPGHKSTTEHRGLRMEDMCKVVISKNSGHLLSVEQLADNLFVETYLSGGYKTQGDIISDRKSELPDYSLGLWSRLCRSVVDKTLDRCDLDLDIMDARKVQTYKSEMKEGEWLVKPEQVLRELQKRGIVKLKVQQYADVLGNIGNAIIGNPQKSGESTLRYLDTILELSQKSEPVVRNLKRNLDCLVNLVLNCRPTINTSDGRFIVYVHDGGVGMWLS